MEAKAASAKAASASRPAEADCGKAVIARVRDTEVPAAGEGPSQSTSNWLSQSSRRPNQLLSCAS